MGIDLRLGEAFASLSGDRSSYITRQLKEAGTVLGIALLDHIIFNRAGYFSFLEAGRL